MQNVKWKRMRREAESEAIQILSGEWVPVHLQQGVNPPAMEMRQGSPRNIISVQDPCIDENESELAINKLTYSTGDIC